MDDRTLAIPVAFILLSALLCWMLIGARGKWWLKLATILIVPAFGIAVWAAISSYKGWPTADEPPEKAVLLCGAVHEPDAKRDDPGVIYLWLAPLPEAGAAPSLNPFDYLSGGGEPRSYKLPYTRQLHDALNGAQAAAKDGRPMMFSRSPKKPGGRGGGRPRSDEDAVEGEESHPGGAGQNGAQGEGERDEYHFYDLPPASPQKPPEQ
jgi:hypothetical protein